MIELKNIFFLYLDKYQFLLKSFSAMFFLRGGVIAINFGTGILLRNELGEANSGQFGLFISALILFNTILNLGFNGSAIYYAKKKPEKLPLYLTTNFIITGISIVVILLALFLFSFYFTFQSNTLRIVFVICYIIYSFSLIYRSFLQGMDENLFMQKVDLGTRIVYGIFMLTLYYWGIMSVTFIIVFMTLEYFVFTCLAHAKSKVKVWPLHWDMSFFKENILFNAKNYLAGFLYILLLKGDQFIIKAFYNNHQVGVYGIGGTIVENMFMVTSIICAMYIPRLLGRDDFLDILENAKKVLFFVLLSSAVMALMVFFFSPWLYEMYFHNQDVQGILSLRILLLGFISLSMFILTYQIYFSVRLKKSLLIILCIGVAVNLLLNYLYLPQYGIIASAWASSICYTLVAILSFIDLYYLKKRNYIRKTLIRDEERK